MQLYPGEIRHAIEHLIYGESQSSSDYAGFGTCIWSLLGASSGGLLMRSILSIFWISDALMVIPRISDYISDARSAQHLLFCLQWLCNPSTTNTCTRVFQSVGVPSSYS